METSVEFTHEIKRLPVQPPTSCASCTPIAFAQWNQNHKITPQWSHHLCGPQNDNLHWKWNTLKNSTWQTWRHLPDHRIPRSRCQCSRTRAFSLSSDSSGIFFSLQAYNWESLGKGLCWQCLVTLLWRGPLATMKCNYNLSKANMSSMGIWNKTFLLGCKSGRSVQNLVQRQPPHRQLKFVVVFFFFSFWQQLFPIQCLVSNDRA